MEMTIRAYLRRAVSAALERSGRELRDGTGSDALRSARRALEAVRTPRGAIQKHLPYEEVSGLISRHDAELRRVRFGATPFQPQSPARGVEKREFHSPAVHLAAARR